MVQDGDGVDVDACSLTWVATAARRAPGSAGWRSGREDRRGASYFVSRFLPC